MSSRRPTTAPRPTPAPWRLAAQDLDDAVARRAPLAELRERYRALDALLDAAFSAATGSCCSRSGPWSREARDLMTARDHYRLAAAGTAGVLVPAGVQVGARHATGPHIAGMHVGPADNAISEEQPPIGVALAATVDAAQPGVPVAARAREPRADLAPPAPAVPLPVQARPDRVPVPAVA